ncbi:2-keto-3-deoxy-L-rhamnonate aldolase [Sulfitobacter sp. JL08]|uniref:aldolase/citrate lyase family protein n=1 Tax=Sulfitobacter sp. JL08 TaxID=2070369 RepID=UPI000E0C0D5C|nr:HpcH/HpaI aldolase/citrate lyase family protein [Sulfitobacter sp. JL08]AXI53131.1 2-keto-3-deoxy-L-rhamnonate aldolase [Sulfitobacter sp. JL08]
MSAPVNTFKAALKDGHTQFGCWMGFADGYAADIMGTAGFDWLVIDGEHAPNDIRSIRDQLIALEPSPSHPVVRVPIGETWMIKQVLDVGAQTVLVPMVDSAEQARDLVQACRYAPDGVRGVGAALARATRFSSVPDYVETANAQICLLVQVESKAGIAVLDDILAVDGIDGVFIGPADLAADMGFGGNSADPEVQAVILGALEKIRAAGKAPGILSLKDDFTQQYLQVGAQFVAVGIDVVMLAQTARDTALKWKS